MRWTRCHLPTDVRPVRLDQSGRRGPDGGPLDQLVAMRSSSASRKNIRAIMLHRVGDRTRSPTRRRCRSGSGRSILRMDVAAATADMAASTKCGGIDELRKPRKTCAKRCSLCEVEISTTPFRGNVPMWSWCSGQIVSDRGSEAWTLSSYVPWKSCGPPTDPLV